jgi:hypothetical protein
VGFLQISTTKVSLHLYMFYQIRDQDFLVKMISRVEWTAFSLYIYIYIYVIIHKGIVKFDVLTVVIRKICSDSGD